MKYKSRMQQITDNGKNFAQTLKQNVKKQNVSAAEVVDALDQLEKTFGEIQNLLDLERDQFGQ